MPRIEKSAVIHRAPAAVWEFLIRRENSPQIVPNLVRVWDITPPVAGIGQTWRFEFKLLELPVEGGAIMTAFDPGRSFQFQTGNAIESRWTYTVAVDGPHTRLTVAVDYNLPATLIESPTVLQLLEAQAGQILLNVEATLRH